MISQLCTKILLLIVDKLQRQSPVLGRYGVTHPCFFLNNDFVELLCIFLEKENVIISNLHDVLESFLL